ncbi:MAG: Gldg family protein [Clostridia bacterium]|nr:Gldg family protein [Clostridia bacterium]
MNRKEKKHFWHNPRFRYGGLSTLLLCVAIAVIIVINAVVMDMEKKNGWRVDYSFNAMTTIGDQTEQLLQGLNKPVHIYALFSKGQEDAPLMELLDRYAAFSPMITWEQADINLNPALLTKFSSPTGDQTVSNDSLIVHCPQTDRFRVLSPADFISMSLNYEEGRYEIAGLKYESEITSAISYVAGDTIPRVVIVQGHGELTEEETEPFNQLMQLNNYEITYMNLMADRPEPTDVVVLFSPVRDLMDQEMEVLKDFAGHGGALLMTCDYTDPMDNMPNYQSLLRSYGCLPQKGIVVADKSEPASYYNNYRINLIPDMQMTDMTMNLVSSGADVLLLTGSAAFALPEEGDRNLDAQAVLTSTAGAYLKDVSAGTLSLDKAPGDLSGPFALAIRARRTTAEGYISRAVAVGCSTMFTSSQVQAMTNAQEFILTAVGYLFGNQNTNLGIMAKTAIRPQLSAASAGMGSFVITLLPFAVIALALIILVPRRRR